MGIFPIQINTEVFKSRRVHIQSWYFLATPQLRMENIEPLQTPLGSQLKRQAT